MLRRNLLKTSHTQDIPFVFDFVCFCVPMNLVLIFFYSGKTSWDFKISSFISLAEK